MSRKRRGKKGSKKIDPKLSYLLFPLAISFILMLPIWAFSPFDQGLFISWIIGSSITLFGVFGYDKSQARSDGKRVPEMNLHLLSLLGGAIGGLLGMFFFRHKTKKKYFYAVLIVSMIVHTIIYLVIWN